MNRFWNKIKRPLLIVLFWYVYWVITGDMSNALLLVALMIYVEAFIRKKKAQ